MSAVERMDEEEEERRNQKRWGGWTGAEKDRFVKRAAVTN